MAHEAFPLKELLASLSGGRPLVVALLVIAICFLLLRPRRKQQPSPAGSSSGSAAGAPQKLPALSLSTRDVLLEFRNGTPQLKQEALEPLFSLSSRYAVFLVTQLPVDTDECEAAVMALLDGAGVFADGRCDRRKAMFCSTGTGRSAMCRQLEPAVHIDSDPQVIGYLAPHLPQIVYVGFASLSLPAGKGSVQTVPTLAAYAS